MSLQPILRRSLAVPVANGTKSFVLPCKKIVFEYCETWGSNRGMREFLANGPIVSFARRYPGVEMVVQRVDNRHPHLRAVYGQWTKLPFTKSVWIVGLRRLFPDVPLFFPVNGRDKVICVRSLPPPSIGAKLQLLLDSSGSKITTLKRPKVESSNESVRGIWSAFHDEANQTTLRRKA
ncbi:BQ5605_C004g02882 [Microbotryum silenes-dioicae]|uniref:Large ribosomal subunit protein mL43 n=1 Tax=Microbotryum silenes-dioicae TaxID=796604 RepID=A0A2X0MW70_9BASI|nr:BQ5605_C004g02882 [Microbotryum silenes-dioicae]